MDFHFQEGEAIALLSNPSSRCSPKRWALHRKEAKGGWGEKDRQTNKGGVSQKEEHAIELFRTELCPPIRVEAPTPPMCLFGDVGLSGREES